MTTTEAERRVIESHDDVRRRLIEADEKLAAAISIANATPEASALKAARAAFRACPAQVAVEEAEEAYAEVEAETPGAPDRCEFCACPLFRGDKVDEGFSSGDGVTICAAAAFEDDARDCPGRRLGLLQKVDAESEARRQASKE